MNKVCKLLLTLSLTGQVLASNVYVMAEEVEDTTVEEVVDETIEETEELETAEPIELTPVDNPEEVIALIAEKNQEILPKTTTGAANLGFAGEGTGATLMAFDYYLDYNVDPRLSAEVDLNFNSALMNEPYHLFAYVHNGKLLEYRDETWYSDDVSQYEEMFTSILSDSTDMSEFYTKYMDVLQSPDSYILRLKEDINTTEFYADLNEVYDLEGMKSELIELMSAQEGFDVVSEEIINTLFSEEKLAATLANESVIEFIFNQESGYLVNTYINLNIPIEDIYEKLEMSAEEAPSNLLFLLESTNTQIGEATDFSFLDEVAPAE